MEFTSVSAAKNAARNVKIACREAGVQPHNMVIVEDDSGFFTVQYWENFCKDYHAGINVGKVVDYDNMIEN